MRKRYKWLAFSLILLLFIVILLLQSVVNVQERLTPPSEKWGHSLKIGETVSIKPPFLEYSQNDLIKASYLTETSIESITMDKDYSTEREAYPIQNKNITSFIKHDNDVIYVLDRQLYSGILNEGGITSSKLLFEEPVLNYSYWQKSEERTLIAVGTPSKVLLYSLTDEGPQELSANAELPIVEDYASRRIVQVTENEGRLQILVFSRPSETAYQYDLLTFDMSTGQWAITPVKHEDTGMKINKNFNDIDYAIDNNNELHVITSYSLIGNSGSERNLEYFSYNLNSLQIVNERKNVTVRSFHGFMTSSVYDVNIIGFDRDERLRMTANVLAIAGRDEATMRMVELALNDGNVDEMHFISSKYAFARSSSAVSNEDGDYLVWLEKASETTYDVKIGSTSSVYNQSVNHITQDMFINAMYSVINSFIFSILTIAITSFWATPGLAIVVWLEWRKDSKWIEKYWSHVMIGAIIVTVAFQIVFFEALFYKPSVVPFMPAWLSFNGAPIIIPIVFGIMMYGAVALYRKSMEIPSLLGLFTFFIVSDLLLLDFLYAPYMI